MGAETTTRRLGRVTLFVRRTHYGITTHGIVLRDPHRALPLAVIRLEHGRSRSGRPSWVWLWAGIGVRTAGVVVPAEIDGLDLPSSRWSLGPVTVYVDPGTGQEDRT